jgi:hypothetical protein
MAETHHQKNNFTSKLSPETLRVCLFLVCARQKDEFGGGKPKGDPLWLVNSFTSALRT